tara:strand:- start:237 stop:944 length:708 start_codon:yes stop_codon:yes gene_type:complete
MNNFQFFININLKNMMIDFIIISNDEINPIFHKSINLENLDNNNLSFNNLDEIMKALILDVEKNLKKITFQKVNLMIEDPSLNSIDLTLKENMENKIINKNKIEYLLKDARYQLIKNHPEKYIAHIIIKKCYIDDEEYNYVPFEINCKNFIIDLSFIYLKKKLILQFEKLLKNQQLEVNKIICTNYAKSLLNDDIDNVSKAGLAALKDINLNEVSVILKKKAKMGFFEKIFHIFS